MKKIILSLSLTLALIACNPLPAPVNNPSTPTPVVQPNSDAKYIALGTLSYYPTAEAAFANRVSGGAYYFIYGTVNVGDKVFSSMSTSTPINGGGKWVCLSFNGGTTWKSIQIDQYGFVLAVK